MSSSFNIGSISDTNKAGTLAIAPSGTGILTANTSLVLTSVGNITSTTGNLYAPGTLTVNSSGGSVGSLANSFLVNDDATISSTTGKTGAVFITVSGSPTLNTVSAPGGVNISAAGYNIYRWWCGDGSFRQRHPISRQHLCQFGCGIGQRSKSKLER